MDSSGLPRTMKALIHNQKQQTLTLIHDQPLPVPDKNEYLLKVHSVAPCAGELFWPRPADMNESIPGTDVAGMIISAPESSKFKLGDAVYARTTYPRAGSAREYSIALEHELALQPKNISATEAATVPVSAVTAWQALFVQAGLKDGFHRVNSIINDTKTRVLVNGASGTTGLWITQLARWSGCHVIGICSGKNASLVLAVGAGEVVDYTQTSILEWARENEKVDIVFDCVGGKSLEDVWHAARNNGQVFTIVPPADFSTDLTPPKDVSNSIKGKFFIMDPSGQQLGHITRLIEEQKVRPVVDSVYKLEDYQQAFERCNGGRAVGKAVIQIAN